MNNNKIVLVYDHFSNDLPILLGRLYIDVNKGMENYSFEYDKEYLANTPERLSVNLPLQTEKFHDKTLFPFFDGLIPEGWLLEIATDNWKLNPNDRMGLLLACCRDCIGATSVREVKVES